MKTIEHNISTFGLLTELTNSQTDTPTLTTRKHSTQHGFVASGADGSY